MELPIFSSPKYNDLREGLRNSFDPDSVDGVLWTTFTDFVRRLSKFNLGADDALMKDEIEVESALRDSEDILVKAWEIASKVDNSSFGATQQQSVDLDANCAGSQISEGIDALRERRSLSEVCKFRDEIQQPQSAQGVPGNGDRPCLTYIDGFIPSNEQRRILEKALLVILNEEALSFVVAPISESGSNREWGFSAFPAPDDFNKAKVHLQRILPSDDFDMYWPLCEELVTIMTQPQDRILGRSDERAEKIKKLSQDSFWDGVGDDKNTGRGGVTGRELACQVEGASDRSTQQSGSCESSKGRELGGHPCVGVSRVGVSRGRPARKLSMSRYTPYDRVKAPTSVRSLSVPVDFGDDDDCDLEGGPRSTPVSGGVTLVV